jgi:hypothetical protein
MNPCAAAGRPVLSATVTVAGVFCESFMSRRLFVAGEDVGSKVRVRLDGLTVIETYFAMFPAR